MKSTKKIPGPNETIRTPLPDSFDGIRFEIGRLIQYVQEYRKDPMVLATAQKVASLALGTARQLRKKVTSETKGRIILHGLWAWARAHFEHVSNPANIEVIKTPARMLREIEIPEALSTAIWEPIRDAFIKEAKEAGKNPAKLKLPISKTTGNSAVATTLILSLAAAVGMDVRMRFGGENGVLYYMWGVAYAGDGWVDVDIIHDCFGKHPKFEHLESVDIGT